MDRVPLASACRAYLGALLHMGEFDAFRTEEDACRSLGSRLEPFTVLAWVNLAVALAHEVLQRWRENPQLGCRGEDVGPIFCIRSRTSSLRLPKPSLSSSSRWGDGLVGATAAAAGAENHCRETGPSEMRQGHGQIRFMDLPAEAEVFCAAPSKPAPGKSHLEPRSRSGPGGPTWSWEAGETGIPKSARRRRHEPQRRLPMTLTRCGLAIHLILTLALGPGQEIRCDHGKQVREGPRKTVLGASSLLPLGHRCRALGVVTRSAMEVAGHARGRGEVAPWRTALTPGS